MPDYRDRISIDPDVCGGKPCIKGTGMRVRDILGLQAAGAPRSEVLADYPNISDANITAVLEFASLQTEKSVLAAE